MCVCVCVCAERGASGAAAGRPTVGQTAPYSVPFRRLKSLRLRRTIEFRMALQATRQHTGNLVAACIHVFVRSFQTVDKLYQNVAKVVNIVEQLH